MGHEVEKQVVSMWLHVTAPSKFTQQHIANGLLCISQPVAHLGESGDTYSPKWGMVMVSRMSEMDSELEENKVERNTLPAASHQHRTDIEAQDSKAMLRIGVPELK